MKIAIGCDPNAKKAKEDIIEFIKNKNLGDVTDFGSDDIVYANVAIEVAKAVASKEYDKGILICGTGIGVSIAANKVQGAYAALISDIYSAERAVLSNNANIGCFGAFTIGNKVREELVQIFLSNTYDSNSNSNIKFEAYKNYDYCRGQREYE